MIYRENLGFTEKILDLSRNAMIYRETLGFIEKT